jgi:hypothetical protein
MYVYIHTYTYTYTFNYVHVAHTRSLTMHTVVQAGPAHIRAALQLGAAVL